ncbi:unnamed protein product [Closterium sp. NIES-53]
MAFQPRFVLATRQPSVAAISTKNYASSSRSGPTTPTGIATWPTTISQHALRIASNGSDVFGETRRGSAALAMGSIPISPPFLSKHLPAAFLNEPTSLLPLPVVLSRDDFLPAVCSWRTAVFCLPARRAPRCARRVCRLSRHTGGPRTPPPPPPPVARRDALGGRDLGGGRASPPSAACSGALKGCASEQPTLVQPPLEQPPLVQPPLDLSSCPWPLEEPPLVQPPLDPATQPLDPTVPTLQLHATLFLDPVQPPPCAACCCSPPTPPFFVSLLRVQPWNGGYGGGGYGGDGWCVSLPLLLLLFPLL